jgi:hypothetical protein
VLLLPQRLRLLRSVTSAFPRKIPVATVRNSLIVLRMVITRMTTNGTVSLTTNITLTHTNDIGNHKDDDNGVVGNTAAAAVAVAVVVPTPVVERAVLPSSSSKRTRHADNNPTRKKKNPRPMNNNNYYYNNINHPCNRVPFVPCTRMDPTTIRIIIIVVAVVPIQSEVGGIHCIYK